MVGDETYSVTFRNKLIKYTTITQLKTKDKISAVQCNIHCSLLGQRRHLVL
jgi:hypothetical protein